MRIRCKPAMISTFCFLLAALPLIATTARPLTSPSISPRPCDTTPESAITVDLSIKDETEVLKALQNAPLTPLGFWNARQSPVEITKAEVRSIKLVPASGAIINDFAMEAHIYVKNVSKHDVGVLRLEFCGESTQFQVTFKFASIKIDETKALKIDLMCVTGNPVSSLVVRPFLAELHGGGTWKDSSMSPWAGMVVPKEPLVEASGVTVGPTQSPDSKNASSTADAAGKNDASNASSISGPVDKRPEALSNPGVKYTARARANNVSGRVMVRVLVGTDGRVKSAKPTRWLPDFLTEQAVSAASEIKFRPATRNGKAVTFWAPVAIEFTLP